jgi:hypothetical protein
VRCDSYSYSFLIPLFFSLSFFSPSSSLRYDGEYHTMGAGLPEPCAEGDTFSACTTKVGKATNEAQVQAFRALVAAPQGATTSGGGGQPKSTAARDVGDARDAGDAALGVVGLVMNGDLTAYWHPFQAHAYEALYETGDLGLGKPLAGAPAGGATVKYYPGIGNHDYQVRRVHLFFNGAPPSPHMHPTMTAVRKHMWIGGGGYSDTPRGVPTTPRII